ncbi:UNVERIFIED_CONTAM: hypothetical protein GTU68_049208 [Idotea baltica]|nr:hypothetical protein [Idotea baltica]
MTRRNLSSPVSTLRTTCSVSSWSRLAPSTLHLFIQEKCLSQRSSKGPVQSF